MRKIPYFLLAFIALTAFPMEDLKQDLQYKWKRWLEEEVAYIITQKEKEIFLSLKSEKERGTFEKAFWLQRDPTFGTQINEYKEEHYERLKHVQEFYSRGSIKPGWKTDRGRIYIILGEPVDIQRFYETARHLVPSELWLYNGDTSLGLPPFFYIIFYQDESSGEYRLYSPSFDGPQRLIRRTFQRDFNRYDAYQQIKEVSAELAEASLSLIPGAGEDPSTQTPSLTSDIFLSSIESTPKKKIQSEWAEAFSRNKEIVTTDYSINYVPSDYILFIHQENKKNYLHAIIEPHRLSMNQYEHKVYAPLKINIKISDLSGKTIHQEEKSIEVEINEDDFKKIERRIPAVGDIIPLVEGNFTINFLMRNTASKEFSSLEEVVSSPSSGMPSLSPILFLYDEKKVPKRLETIPFLIRKHQLYPNSQKIYTKGDYLIIFFEIYYPSLEFENYTLNITTSQDEKVLASYAEQIKDQAYFLKRFPLRDYKAGYYKVQVSVADDTGNEILAEKDEFKISPLATIPRPWNYNKIYPHLNHPYFSIIRAYQYLGCSKNDSVIQEIKNFYVETNHNKEIAVLLARAYFKKGNYLKVIEILDPLRDIQDLYIFRLLGKSYFQIKNYESATEYFKKALIAGGEIIEILNFLGYCYFTTNKPKEALKYFERSLKLNPNQPNIRKVVKKIKDRS